MKERYSLRYFPERYRTAFPVTSSKATQLLRVDGVPTAKMLPPIQQGIVETFTREMAQIPLEQRPLRPAPIISQVLSLAFAYGKFHIAGRQIYDIGPKMQAVLVGADYHEVPVSMLTLPFASLYLHFGPQAFDIKGAPFEGAWVSEYQGRYEIFLTTQQHQGYLAKQRFTHPAQYLYVTFDVAGYPPDTPLGDVIADAVKEEMRTLTSHSSLPVDVLEHEGVTVIDRRGEGAQEDLENYQIAIQSLDEAMRLVVNALIFLTSYREHVNRQWTDDTPPELSSLADDSVGKAKARNDAKQKLLAEGYYQVNFVGERFDYEESEAEGMGNSAGMRPHWRRSHWRVQRFGVGRQESKLVLIRQILVNADKLATGQEPPGRISKL